MSSKIEINQEFFEGDIVQYKNTGTIGKIILIKKINDEFFAKLDSTGLYYNINYLDKITKNIYIKEDKIKGNIMDDIKEKMNIKEEAIFGYSSENIDSPGGAG